MGEDRRREIGLFRYALVRDAADPALSKAERGRLVRALAEREHVDPDGRLVRVARGTLDEWIRAYRRGGFEALLPRPRVVAPRTSAELLELAFALKRERPDRTAAQVREVMLAAGGGAPGLRTLQRHLARQGLNVRADGRSPGKVYGRFEAAQRNELWTGDGLHGPKLDGPSARRAVLLAFIDDHSRLLVGWRWGTGEDVFRLEAALRSGLMSRGVPAAILVDRGSAFVSSQLLRACAVLGVRLVHASPRAAASSAHMSKKREAGAPERERMRQEAEERRRQRHEEFLAAGKAKRWQYQIVGECHLDKRKKRFATSSTPGSVRGCSTRSTAARCSARTGATAATRPTATAAGPGT